MVSIKRIQIDKIEELVRIAFKNDTDLIEKYHSIDGTFEECVDDTIIRIYASYNEKHPKYYKILNNKEAIGFFVTFVHKDIPIPVLYSFGINIKYRKAEILNEWWKLILKELDSKFWCAMNKKNERAIKFLRNRTMKVVKETENEVVFINKPLPKYNFSDN